MIHGRVILDLEHTLDSSAKPVNIHLQSLLKFTVNILLRFRFSGSGWNLRVGFTFLYFSSSFFLTFCFYRMARWYRSSMDYTLRTTDVKGASHMVLKLHHPTWWHWEAGEGREKRRTILRWKSCPLEDQLFLVFKLVATWEWTWSAEQQGEGSLGEKGPGSFAKAFPEICSQVSLEL